MEDLLQIIEDRIKALETEATALGRRRVRLQHREVGIVRTQINWGGWVPVRPYSIHLGFKTGYDFVEASNFVIDK